MRARYPMLVCGLPPLAVRALWGVVMTCAANASAAQTPAARDTAVERRLDAYLRAQADSGFSGVVLVAARGGVRLHGGYGGPGSRPTKRAAFWIASNTKPLTAAAVLRLRDAGRLFLDDSIARFFPGAPAAARRITVRELLTHTSGVAGRNAADGITDRARAVEAILATPLEYEPGRGYRYINDDYVLLAAIVEVASGERYERFMRRAILAPAGLTSTGFCGEPRGAAGKRLPSHPCDGPKHASWGGRGATGVFSTAADLQRWLRALAAGAVLSDSSRAQMISPQVFVRRESAGDVHYGYGWGLETADGRTRLVRHFGEEAAGYSSALWLGAEGDTIVVLSAAGRHGDRSWSSVVARQLARLLAAGRSP